MRLNSRLGPGALLETAAPRDQLVNSAGIGWQPYLDIGAGKKPGPVSSRETLRSVAEYCRVLREPSTGSEGAAMGVKRPSGA